MQKKRKKQRNVEENKIIKFEEAAIKSKMNEIQYFCYLEKIIQLIPIILQYCLYFG